MLSLQLELFSLLLSWLASDVGCVVITLVVVGIALLNSVVVAVAIVVIVVMVVVVIAVHVVVVVGECGRRGRGGGGWRGGRGEWICEGGLLVWTSVVELLFSWGYVGHRQERDLLQTRKSNVKCERGGRGMRG
jgi:hypothetical protein